MKAKYVIILVFGALLFGTAYIQFVRNAPRPTQKAAEARLNIKQTILIDGKKKQEVVPYKRCQTALSLLNSTHTILTTGENKNAFITSIDGRVAKNDNREFWSFYVNGKQAEVGAGSYILKNNDTIEWKIETY